ncbi:MAG TPA: BTAD domain-containing putative transcriptional regulator [Anaerolineae bacterium]|nr:BTAD domain-containing putative transcriptional regulator [Anaerolineae bacterium]
MPSLNVSLFGKFYISYDNHHLLGFEGIKLQELFCYLLLFRDRPHPRETLAELLWSHSPQSRKNLRKALWQLQTALDVEVSLNSHDFLSIESDWIQLNSHPHLWLDTAVLEQSFQQVQNLPGSQLDPTSAQMLQVVIEHYRGDLLESCYADWCLLERERYRHMYLAILDKLMAYCEISQQYAAGISYGEIALRYDRARERTHRRLMRLFHFSGYRTEALRQYARCVQALAEELSVEPTQQTRQLYEQIRVDSLQVSPLPQLPPPAEKPSTLALILSQIQQAQSLLAEAQRQLQRQFKE